MTFSLSSEIHGTSSHHCEESGAGTSGGNTTSQKRSGWYWTGLTIHIYSLVLMPVKNCTAVFMVSLELGKVSLKVKTEGDEGLMQAINLIMIGWCGLGATISEEDVISIGINESRRYLSLERERSRYGSRRVRSWRRKPIRMMILIAVQINTIISTE